MHGHSTFGGPVDWTTLVTADGYLHPSAAAHSALAWLLEDTEFVRCVTLADGVYAYLFRGPARSVAAITSAPTHAPTSCRSRPPCSCSTCSATRSLPARPSMTT